MASAAFLLAVCAVWGVEGRPSSAPASPAQRPTPPFRDAVADMLADPEARRFTVFVFLSMLAYSMQDLILEPFAGLLFAMTPGESTRLSGLQHAGVFAGMVLVGAVGGTFGGRARTGLRWWIVGGCIGSALALAGLAMAARVGTGWPLAVNIVALGFANGVFAVAAIGAMMGLAGAGGGGREGIRMGIWGASQAIAFGLGGLIGAIGVDVGRGLTGSTPDTFTLVFAVEAALFLLAASLALRGSSGTAPALAPA